MLSKNGFSFKASTALKRSKYEEDVIYTYAADTMDDVLGHFSNRETFSYLLLMKLILWFLLHIGHIRVVLQAKYDWSWYNQKYDGLFCLVIFKKYGHSPGVQA